MSYYLVERIKAQPNIEVLTRSEVTALEGCDGNLGNGALAPLRAAESRL
jgi:heterodisulfide reductase subunit A-like polyferredoxin